MHAVTGVARAAFVVERGPVGRHSGHAAREVGPLPLARLAAQPHEDVDFVPAARNRPAGILRKRIAILECGALEREISLKERHHARVARRLAPVAQRPEHDHVRPPVAILRTEVAVLALRGDVCVQPLLRACLELRVVKGERKREEALRIVRPTFPRKLPAARAARDPVALADVLVQLLRMAGQPVALHLHLLEQPTLRPDVPRRQARHRARTNRRAIQCPTRTGHRQHKTDQNLFHLISFSYFILLPISPLPGHSGNRASRPSPFQASC